MNPLRALALCAVLIWTAPADARRPAPKPASPTVRLVYSPPMHPGNQWVSINSIRGLFEHFAAGELTLNGVGQSAFRGDRRYLLVETDVADGTQVQRLLAATEAPTREVLEGRLPVLVSDYDLLFQYPFTDRRDWLSVLEDDSTGVGLAPGFERREAALVRLRAGEGDDVVSALALEFEGAPPLVLARERWSRVFAGRASLQTPDEAASIYAIGRSYGLGSRMAAELESRLAGQEPLTFYVRPSGVSCPDAMGGEVDLCLRATKALMPAAVLPGSGDLRRGPKGLKAFTTAHHIPFVAANLAPAGAPADGPRFFDRFKLIQREGVTVAFIGVMGRDMLDGLPATVTGQWRLEDPVIAAQKALKDLTAREGHKPDVVVLLAATRDPETLARLEGGNSGADVVIGRFDRVEVGTSTTTVRYDHDRAQHTYTFAPFAARGGVFHVGELLVQLTDGAAGAREIAGVAHTLTPVTPEGPRDADLVQRAEAHADAKAARDSQVLLPDLGPVIEGLPDAHPLVWGARVLSHGRFVEVTRPQFKITDPLWMRLVTHVMRETSEVEVAISRNLSRSYSIVGPVSRLFIDNWTSAPDVVHTMTVKGQALRDLAERLRRQDQPDVVAAEDFLFASGLDAQRQKVLGRTIEPNTPYRVAITDAVLAMPDVKAILAGAASDPDTSRLKDMVLARLDGWRSPETGDFDPVHLADLTAAFAAPASDVAAEWRVTIKDISLKAAGYGNTAQGGYAESKETRLNTPDNVSVQASADISLIYDGPAVAWQTRAKATFQYVSLDIPGAPDPVIQEPFDDVVLSTELRFNAIQLGIGADQLPLVPYVNMAYDTEFTPIADPADPAATLPHQHLLRAGLGWVLYPGRYVSEVRIGGLYRADLSQDQVRHDGGLGVGLVMNIPIWGPIAFISDTDFQYFIGDGDDAVSDLSLQLHSQNKLVVGLAEGLALFGFADLFFAAGKVPGYREVRGSYILGGGLSFSRIFKL